MSTLIWFDGRVHQPHEPLVSALDRGLTVGDGVFDTCAVIAGRPFALRRHVTRLARSAAMMGLTEPAADVVTAAALELAAHLEGGTGRLRMIWTAGPGAGGSPRTDSQPTLVLTASSEAVAHPSPEGHGTQARTAVAVVPWPRNERSPLAGVKSISYGENVVAVEHARARGAGEAIFANTRGELCEGSATNVFLDTGDELLTPPLESGCLAGITRELVLEWGRAAGIPIREQTIPIDEFTGAQHAALTSSLRGIVPIDELDGRPLSPGPLTAAMRDVYAARVAEDLDP